MVVPSLALPVSYQVLLHSAFNAAHAGPNGARCPELVECTSQDLAVIRAIITDTGMPDSPQVQQPIHFIQG